MRRASDGSMSESGMTARGVGPAPRRRSSDGGLSDGGKGAEFVRGPSLLQALGLQDLARDSDSPAFQVR